MDLNSSSSAFLSLQKLARHIFSGAYLPGDRLIERDLATKLKVSRVPVREGLLALTCKGILCRAGENRSLRLREYSPDEIIHLHEYREAIEIAAGMAACQNRSETELMQLQLICDAMEAEAPRAPSALWHSLDWQFHEHLVQASRNERFIRDFSLLLIEYDFVFYRLPQKILPTAENDSPLIRNLINDIVQSHRQLVVLLETRETSHIAPAIRRHIAGIGHRVHRENVRQELLRKKV